VTSSLVSHRPAPPAPGPAHHARRRISTLSRWLHIYLSMASFGILFFFAATGLTLNHTEWFASQQRAAQIRGSMNTNWLRGKEVNKLEVVEFLRKTHHIQGAMADFRVDDLQCGISFRGPGYSADTFVDRKTGQYDLTETRNGFFAVMNDLHKGRDSGPRWSLLIDLSAILMTLVSLTGMVLIFLLKRYRASGLIAAAAGCLICWGIYVAWVP
jgi:hypothetical protein